MTEQQATPMFSDSVYLKLKAVALIWMPALTTLYFTLGTLWGWPYMEQILGTSTALNTFLGVLLGVSTKAYNASNPAYDGHMAIHRNENGGLIYSLELDQDPEALATMDKVTFRVGAMPPSPSE